MKDTGFGTWSERLKRNFDALEQTRTLGPQVDLIEIFCGDDSSLTHQVQMQKGSSIRFGLAQDDLQSTEGRKMLFQSLHRHRPKHAWMSPVCGPWSKWSQLNSQKSTEAWDRIHNDRADKLIQVALCLVICRHQHRHSRHAHWEQPKGSLMFSLPYLNELFQYMLPSLTCASQVSLETRRINC